jgi:hypothetical protein
MICCRCAERRFWRGVSGAGEGESKHQRHRQTGRETQRATTVTYDLSLGKLLLKLFELVGVAHKLGVIHIDCLQPVCEKQREREWR